MSNVKILTIQQDALLRTVRTIALRCEQNQESVAKVPRFNELVTVLNETIAKIDAAIEAKQESRSTKSVTKQKNEAVTDLIAYVDELATITVTIANNKKNNDWLAKAEKALKKNLKDNSEEGIQLIAREFYRLLQSIDAETLAHYGIDADEVESVDVKIKETVNWRLRKDMATDQKVLDNKTVSQLFAELDAIKSEMDNLSSRFKTKAPDFMAIYDKAQTINQKAGAKQGRSKKDTTAPQGNADTNGEIKSTASNNTSLTTGE